MSEAVTSQPVLFDLAECERHLVELAARDQDRFTGTTTERDAELVSTILRAVVAGVPTQHIADLAKVSPKTVLSVVERAELRGEIADYKQRMTRLLKRGTTVLAEQCIEDALAGKVPAGQKWVSLAIGIDKTLLMTGEATSRVEHVERVRPEDILEHIKRAKVVDLEPVKE